ncbi:MAG: putative rane protein [Actinomycetia bacterium]|nr:putative rane protein [Actinomycetes bacterium]
MTRGDADRTSGDDQPEDSSGAGDDLHNLLNRLERLVDPRSAVRAAQGPVGAAWRSVTTEEPRVQVTVAVVVAIGLMLALPSRVANHPMWVLPGLASLLLIGVFVARSARVERRSRALRVVSLLLIGVMSLSNAASAGRLIVDLARAEGVRSPTQLLLTGGAIWLTNVIVFGLWYWEFDRGGPLERAAGVRPYPDFVFPQMTSPELAPPEWEPGFVDYLYVSSTNAMAFSPTDVMPMTRWAKLTMLTQALISVITVALVIARAVNILK